VLFERKCARSLGVFVLQPFFAFAFYNNLVSTRACPVCYGSARGEQVPPRGADVLARVAQLQEVHDAGEEEQVGVEARGARHARAGSRAHSATM
jgi:hypothetical protein